LYKERRRLRKGVSEMLYGRSLLELAQSGSVERIE
jgi:hypothetical protein